MKVKIEVTQGDLDIMNTNTHDMNVAIVKQIHKELPNIDLDLISFSCQIKIINEQIKVTEINQTGEGEDCGSMQSITCPNCNGEVQFADMQWWESKCECGEWTLEMSATLDKESK